MVDWKKKGSREGKIWVHVLVVVLGQQAVAQEVEWVDL